MILQSVSTTAFFHILQLSDAFFTGCNFTDLVEFHRSHHSLWQKQQQFLANKARDDTVSFLQGHR